GRRLSRTHRRLPQAPGAAITSWWDEGGRPDAPSGVPYRSVGVSRWPTATMRRSIRTYATRARREFSWTQENVRAVSAAARDVRFQRDEILQARGIVDRVSVRRVVEDAPRGRPYPRVAREIARECVQCLVGIAAVVHARRTVPAPVAPACAR